MATVRHAISFGTPVAAPRMAPGPPGELREDRAQARAARQRRIAEAVRLTAAGVDPDEVCARVGVARATLRHYLADHRANGGTIDVDLQAGTEQMRTVQSPKPAAAAPRQGAPTHWNGRKLEEWEREIIAAGHEQAATGEKAMLGERPLRKVA